MLLTTDFNVERDFNLIFWRASKKTITCFLPYGDILVILKCYTSDFGLGECNMGMPAAKMGDQVTGTDIHIILIPAPPGPDVPTPLPHPFTGTIVSECSTNVKIGGAGAAVVGSKAKNVPPHIPQGGSFANPPNNEGIIVKGSATVMINGKPAARNGDTVLTCNDPAPAPTGTIIAVGNVLIGG